MREMLNQEHAGFAITLEVICTLAIMCTFLNCTLYILRVMNVQRYMNTVMTSTAAQAARWGGGNSKAYRDNISQIPLTQSSQEQLWRVASDFNPVISISPDKISYDGERITVNVRYSLPPIFSTMSKVNGVGNATDMYSATRNMQMQVSVSSIMEPGKLL